jgi:hypothetical protein
MGEIINLRHTRKQRARAAAEALARENRRRFGLTAPAKAADKLQQARDRTRLDGARLEQPASDPAECDPPAAGSRQP